MVTTVNKLSFIFVLQIGAAAGLFSQRYNVHDIAHATG